MKEKKIRKVFLDKLPKNKIGNVDWIKSKNYIVPFVYDDIKGLIKIVDVKRENNRTMLYVKYLDDNVFKIFTGHFIQCKIKEMLGLINHEHQYKVSEIIKDEKRNLLMLEQFYIKGNRYYKYKCLNCGYTGNISEGHLNNNQNCSVCSHKKVEKEINSIWKTDNELVKYFVNKEDSYKYSHYSEQYIPVKCPDCGNIRKISILNLYINGFTCPKCGDGISMPNKMMFNILEQLLGLDNFKREYSPTWIGRRLYDFYFELNNKKYIIEMDGGLGHGNEVYNTDNITSEEYLKIDNYKDEKAIEYGVEKPIRIDCNPSKFDYIKRNILNNDRLNKLFNLSKIDWNNVFQYTLTNKMKEACDLWNDNYNVLEISNKLKLSDSTIRRYLNNGNKLNLCCYNGIENIGLSNARAVKCIEYNLVFNTITECASKLSKMLNLNFNTSNISQVCKGNRKTHNKLHFEFT